jgi:hypothetical protein
MAFHLPKPIVPLLAIAMGAMVLSAAAQPSGQSIIFSSPQNDDSQSATPSLAPQNSQMPVLPGTLQAPVSPFNYGAPNDLPVPQQANSSEQQRMGKILEERKNWTLMTPAEIFGVTATEKLLQPPERDAMGREKNQTQLERYLERETQLRTGPTNRWQSDGADSPWNFSRDKDNVNPFDFSRRGADETTQNLNRFLNGQRNSDASANQNGNVGWDSFSTPAQQQTPEKQNLEQLAAMERFRQLLEPSSATEAPSPDSKFFPVPKTVLDPNITQPDFVLNPAGASFTPLASGIGKPAGLTPLPGLINSTPQSAATPAWAPQPPPWLLQGPQPFTFTTPQRKF